MKKAVKSVQSEIILGFAKSETFPCRVYGWFQFLERTRLVPKHPLPKLSLPSDTHISPGFDPSYAADVSSTGLKVNCPWEPVVFWMPWASPLRIPF